VTIRSASPHLRLLRIIAEVFTRGIAQALFAHAILRLPPRRG
jgi:hypothetical protein